MAGRGFPASIDRWLGHGAGVWGRLTARAARLRRLQPTVQGCLEAVSAGSPTPPVRVAAFDGGDLLLVTESPAWSARLRYQEPALLTCLTRSGLLVSRIRVRVTPAPPPDPPRRARPARLSPHSARLLDAYARSVHDPALRAALERLASRGSRGGG